MRLQARNLEESLRADYPLSLHISPYKDAVHWIQFHPNPIWPHLKLFTPAMTLFPRQVIFTETGGWNFNIYILGKYNSTYNKYLIITSIKAEKIIRKIQYPLRIKTLSQLEIKAILPAWQKTTAENLQLIFYWMVKDWICFSQNGNKVMMSTHTISIHHHTGNPDHCNEWMNAYWKGSINCLHF